MKLILTTDTPEANPFRVEFTIAVTTAPVAYDGFGTFTLADAYYFDKPARLVAIRTEQKDWQSQRYASGLNGYTEDVAGECYIDEQTVFEKVLSNLRDACPLNPGPLA